MLVTGCDLLGGGAPDTTVALSSSTSSSTVPVASGPSQVYEVGQAVTHPNGTQLRLDRVEVFEDAVKVVVGLTNGSRFEQSFEDGAIELRTDTGVVSPLLAQLEAPEFLPGDDLSLDLLFGPIGEARVVTFALNDGGGSSPTSSNTTSPAFVVGPITLDPEATAPPLPATAFLDRTGVSGTTEIQVQGLAFTDTRIGVAVTVSNRSEIPVAISPTAAPTFIADDLGNIHTLVLPVDETFLAIPPGEAASGVLAFAGRVDPKATSLDLGINANPATLVPAEFPLFLFEDLPITGETPESLSKPEPIEVGEEIEHPSGVSVALDSMRFTDSGIQAGVEVTNPGDGSAGLAASGAYVIDDTGARFLLQPPAENPELMLDPSSTLSASLVFGGRPVAAATEVTVVFNAGGSDDAESTSSPRFVFGPFPLTRTGSAGAVPAAPAIDVALRSGLAPAELASSEIEEVADILRQFDATEVEGGFRLTLPDDILFEFNSADLSDDAADALLLIVDVLEYFEGDPLVVIGHTDSVGSDSYNKELSQTRAENVVAFLAEQGIDRERMEAEGRGAAEPVAPNTNDDGSDNPEGRQANRRVEIEVRTDKPLP
jgi:outer membrane protein OmpA-like peptidoglycan-associated protein